MAQHYVLRCAITGDAFASQDEAPEDLDFPVEWDGRECYWALETYTPRARAPEPETGVCPMCGADTWNGTCTYDMSH